MDDPLAQGMLESPWGGPTESRLDYRLVDSLVRVVNSGTDLMRVQVEGSKNSLRQKRVKKLWEVQEAAQNMVLREVEKRRKKAKQRGGEIIDVSPTRIDDGLIQFPEEDPGDLPI